MKKAIEVTQRELSKLIFFLNFFSGYRPKMIYVTNRGV